MGYLRLVRAALTLHLLLAASAYNGQLSSPSPAPNPTEQLLSQRVVAYQIDARLKAVA
jgi:hypothetical protein